ncbi:hypothetical protein TNCT1_54270 [Streptomyces sp. 1-11]|nr:hypothetical protein TNCT1_54270 [Streptomyces sp. 1-11]
MKGIDLSCGAAGAETWRSAAEAAVAVPAGSSPVTSRAPTAAKTVRRGLRVREAVRPRLHPVVRTIVWDPSPKQGTRLASGKGEFTCTPKRGHTSVTPPATSHARAWGDL